MLRCFNNYRMSVLASRLQAGLTLVELLIVMGLLTLLATFSLSGMRDLMRSQKVSQASTLVKQYLQNAQIRAISNGRPVAVFLDRVSLIGDRSLATNHSAFDAPVAGNYSVTRLQFGEVFPPYIGDVQDVFGVLGEPSVGAEAYPGTVGTTTRAPDGHADQITFSNVADVVSGLGPTGFISLGDLIGIEGDEGLFRIERIVRSGTAVTVQFFNPPKNYNNGLQAKKAAGIVLDPVFESAVGTFATSLVLPSSPKNVRFRIYRQPTKSLIGAVNLPRGTCVDLSLSGLGPDGNGAWGGIFGLTKAPSYSVPPPPYNPSPADFSRVGIVFDAQGRVSYLIHENQINNIHNRVFSEVSSNLYLMVGRTDQVLPGLQPAAQLQVPAAQTLAALSDGEGELPKGNLLDQENVWITCNPFTGEIKSSPVDTVTPVANAAFDQYIRQARQSAIAGLTN